MNLRLVPAPEVDLLQEVSCGRYRVQVFRTKPLGIYRPSEVVYRVLLDGCKIACLSEEDERNFPRAAAWMGTELVIQWRDRDAGLAPKQPRLFEAA